MSPPCKAVQSKIRPSQTIAHSVDRTRARPLPLSQSAQYYFGTSVTLASPLKFCSSVRNDTL